MLELFCYLLLSVILLPLAIQRPVWGVAYYMLNFFAHPGFWHWGASLPVLRWSLIAGSVLLVSLVVNPDQHNRTTDNGHRLTTWLLLTYLVNATLVHMLLAYSWTVSQGFLTEILKYTVLYFLVLHAIRSEQDFRQLIMFLVAGLAYWGLQAKFGAVSILRGRLEGFGGPGCATSNELASCVVALLPLVGAMLFLTTRWSRVMVVLGASSGLNVLLLCNSRGGFVGMIAAVLMLPLVSRAELRRMSIKGLALGGIATFLLLGNPLILERFLTTFYDAKQSAAVGRSVDYVNKESRKFYWKAGLRMFQDFPLGSGGNAFAAGKGNNYLPSARFGEDRSLHQGVIREATDWGLQGLVLHFGVIASAAFCALRTTRRIASPGRIGEAFLGPCIVAAMAGWLITCMFSDVLHLEWGWWLVIVAVAYERTYSGMGGAEETTASESSRQGICQEP